MEPVSIDEVFCTLCVLNNLLSLLLSSQTFLFLLLWEEHSCHRLLPGPLCVQPGAGSGLSPSLALALEGWSSLPWKSIGNALPAAAAPMQESRTPSPQEDNSELTSVLLSHKTQSEIGIYKPEQYQKGNFTWKIPAEQLLTTALLKTQANLSTADELRLLELMASQPHPSLPAEG